MSRPDFSPEQCSRMQIESAVKMKHPQLFFNINFESYLRKESINQRIALLLLQEVLTVSLQKEDRKRRSPKPATGRLIKWGA